MTAAVGSVLLVDLNNFARYPTLAVGYLCAILRNAGFEVEVISPLAFGIEGYPRPSRARPWGLLDERLRYWSATTQLPIVPRLRDRIRQLRGPGSRRDIRALCRQVRSRLERRPDVVLISAYTMYYDACRAIAQLCGSRGIPVIVGGNYFIHPEIVRRWLTLEGVTAVVGGEPE